MKTPQHIDRLTAEKRAQAARIRQALKKKDWSAGRLAKELSNRGVKTSRTTAYQWIDEDVPSSPTDWTAIADILGEPVEWLRDGKSSHSQIDSRKYLEIFKIVVEETAAMGYSLSDEQIISITSLIYNRTPGSSRDVDRSLVADAVTLARL